MSGKFPDVEQQFTADTSRYIAAMRAAMVESAAFVRSVDEAIRSIGRLEAAMGALAGREIRVTADVSQALGEISRVREALGSLPDREVTVTTRYVTVGDRPGAGPAGPGGGAGPGGADYTRLLNEQADAADRAVASLREYSDARRRLRISDATIRTANDYAAALRNVSDASAGVPGSVWNDLVGAPPRGGAAPGVSPGRARDAAAQERDLASARYSNAMAGYLAARTAAGVLGGGRGGGGGGGGGYIALGGGADLPAGSAGRDAAAIVGFVRRWWTPVHFAIMGVNEILATALPAAAAASAAAAVGWQGVEQMIPRYQAITKTAESLGGAYGITAGQYLGMGANLQRFQNLATGGVYELGGAGISMARAGQGPFLQMGLNTVAMLDRGVANMQIGMAQRGTMGTLAGVLGGGTGYLRQFGDIGANLGNIFLGMAPHLPGVGSDYISLLEGITGALSGGIGWLNRPSIPGVGRLPSMGNVLGLGLAGEAGWRVGRPAVGLLGRGLGGLGGLLAERAPLGSALESLGFGLSGFGGGLQMLGGPEVAMLAMSAFLGGKLISSMPSPAMRQMAALQGQIGQMGFVQGWQPLTHAISVSAGLAGAPDGAPPGMSPAMAAAMGTMQGVPSFARFGTIGPTTQDVYRNAMTGFQQQMADVMNAGPQLLNVMKQAGFHGANMADAFQFAQNALLDFGHSFDKSGKLNQTAITQMMNYGAALKPMTQNYGAFGATLAAQTILGAPAMKDLSTVNQAMDSMSQIMTAGPVGMATLFGLLGGAPVTRRPTRAGMQLSAPPAYTQMARALTSFTTPGGAAAWRTFAGPQGLIASEQANLDQLRTALTLQALTPGQAAQLGGFQIQQMLPLARQSPAALAMLMNNMVQAGIPGAHYYDTGRSQKANYQDAVSATAKIAANVGQANALTTQMAVRLADLPATAKQFSQQFQPSVLAQEIAAASTSMQKVLAAATEHGKVNLPALKDVVTNMRLTGMDPGTIRAQIQSMISGLPKSVQVKIMADVGGALGPISSVRSALAGLHDSRHKVEYDVGQALAAAHSAAMAGQSVPDITRYITYVVRMIGSVTGSPGGVPLTAAGVAAQAPALYTRMLHRQHGGLIPGSGSGDTVPAMLEPGEVVIPRDLVPMISPFLAAHGVPGFGSPGVAAAGGVTRFAAGGAAGGAVYDWTLTGHGGQLPLPAIIGRLLDQLDAEVSRSGIGRQFAITLMGQFTSAIRNLPAETQKLAQGLVSRVTQEVGYARGAAQAAMYGQGYDPSGKGAGIFGSMDVTPGTGGGTVYEQMQDYLGTVKSFTGDIGTLRRQHLDKAIIAQLIAAGPVQGDALAQSILQDYGGVRGVNQLWKQLGAATRGLGAQAAMAQYGGYLSPSLAGARVSVGGITINVSAPGGTTLALTPSQIRQITEEIQAKLLQQARRNPKTGVRLSGKGT